MTATADRQEYTFQTETKQLLHLLSHSLYQNREITIRELISNASDALDKMHFLQLTDESVRNDTPLEIVLEPNQGKKTLTIQDTGVGMTREELVENLGTIAHSGSLAFLEKLSDDSEKDLSLIGQFGVGFYSSFMVADRVEVFSRSCQSDEGLRWESDGTGSFTIEPADVETRGTAVVLHLKDNFEEFTDPFRLRAIVRKYSSFVRHPIKLQPEAEEGKPAADPEQLNEQRPIWVEPKSQIDDEQYQGFYQHLAHRGGDEKLLWHMHLSSDSPLQFHSILYCPPTNLEPMGFGKTEHGLHLCAKRILVEDDNRELLPEYLRFLYGIVDSDDLPLNVSRQALQDDTIFRKIRKVLVKKILDHLAKLAVDDTETYRTFIEQFGPILREGIPSDFEHRERIAKLLRYHSSKVEDDELISLDDYVDRIKTKTDDGEPTDEKASKKRQPIYYATGTSVASIRRNPNLEIFEKREIEVLFLVDPIDELVFNHLGRYCDHDLVSIESADLELPDTDDGDSSEEAESAPNFDQLLVLVRDALGDDVAEVRASKRLTESPCCVVTGQGLGTQLQKVLAMQHDDFSMSKHTFELNPKHPFVRRLGELVPNPDNKTFIEECSRQLLANALLQAGLAPKPEEAISRTQRFMDELAGGRSSIMT
jgi:molecular chaperone HtpG